MGRGVDREGVSVVGRGQGGVSVVGRGVDREESLIWRDMEREGSPLPTRVESCNGLCPIPRKINTFSLHVWCNLSGINRTFEFFTSIPGTQSDNSWVDVSIP